MPVFPAHVVVSRALSLAEELLFLEAVSPHGRVSPKSSLDLSFLCSWTPPPRGWFKVSCDAAWSPEAGAGFGFVGHDYTGTLRCAGMKHSMAASPLLGEILALCWAIERVASTGEFGPIIIEADSIGALMAIGGESSLLHPVLLQARNLF